uniref:TLC domain-containing protein n=2 Tax=Aegilops tauschii subsp. strangulata TaxID=200361 RepID=A0A453ENS1_AEGTS
SIATVFYSDSAPVTHAASVTSLPLPLYTPVADCSTSLLFLPPSANRSSLYIIIIVEARPPRRRAGSGWGRIETMEDFVLSYVVTGLAFWSTAFLVMRALMPKRSYEFCNRAVSTMHAVAAVCMACLSVQEWSCPVCPLNAPSSPRQMKSLAVTLSYMIYDGACCHLSGDARLDNALHHLISIVGLAAGLAYQRCGTELVACLLVTEISSPLLHLREMLKELGVKDTDLNLLVDILFAVTFSVARMVCGTYVTYRTVTADNPILIKTMATSLLLVSAYWFLRILRMVRHKIGKKRLASKAAGKGSM